MLIEINDVIQYEAGKRRRWFHDDFFDLYTWEADGGELLDFQLCYAKLGKERALRWSAETGYRHDGIDAPEDKPGRSMTALFVADGVFDTSGIGAIFENASIELPGKIKEFVLGKIRAYSQPI